MSDVKKKPKLFIPHSDSGAGRESTSQAIVRDVVRGLYEGRYVPGQRLVEPDMMQDYGVSRSTIRETIKQLTSDGIAVYVQFRGAHIRQLTRGEAMHIFSLTEVVLGLASRQAADSTKTPDAKDALLACVAAICAHDDVNDRFEFIRLRNQFFRKVVEISGNGELMKIIPKLQVHLVRKQLLVPKADRVAGYTRIAAEILASNGDKADAVTREYVRKIASITLPHFDGTV